MKNSPTALALLAFIAVICAVPARAAERTWITDVTLVSPEKLDRVEVGSVLIEDGRIVRVERGKAARNPEGATVVSGKGKFLIPGLIDSHVHLAAIPGLSVFADQQSAMATAYFRQLPRSYLYYGYTTLVDLAVFNRKVLDDFRKAPLHPDLYDCGQAMPFANGYPMSFAPPEVRFKLFPNFIYDPAQAASIPPEFKPEDHTPEAAVKRVKDSGGICVKTFFEHGFGRDRNLPVTSPEVFARIRAAATKEGLVLVMHGNSFESQRFAVEGGADVIAHGMWHWGEFDRRTDLPDEFKPVLDAMVAKKTGYQSTFRVLYGESAYFDSAYLKDKAIPKIIPKALLDWFNTREGQWFKEEVREGDAPDAAVVAGYEAGPLRRERQVTGYLAGKDANFLFGTDTPSGPTYGNLPGLNGYLEMLQLEKAGLSLAQIFRAATLNNARAFKLDAQVGTIEAGKVANLVLLEKSPLESVAAYDSIVAVWIHGKRVARASLAAPSGK